MGGSKQNCVIRFDTSREVDKLCYQFDLNSELKRRK